MSHSHSTHDQPQTPYGMVSYKTEQLGIDHNEFTDPLLYNTAKYYIYVLNIKYYIYFEFSQVPCTNLNAMHSIKDLLCDNRRSVSTIRFYIGCPYIEYKKTCFKVVAIPKKPICCTTKIKTLLKRPQLHFQFLDIKTCSFYNSTVYSMLMYSAIGGMFQQWR